MKPWYMILLATTVPALCFASQTAPAQAFCVYNKSDKPIYARPVSLNPKMFSATIKTSDSACCNWKNGDCNPTKKRDSVLETEVSVEFSRDRFYCGTPRKDIFGRPEPNYPRVKMQGGGYLVVLNDPAFKGAPPKSYFDVKVGESAHLVQSWTYDHKLLDTYPCARVR